jgi:DNA-binding transcriptional MerR regulator
MSEAEISKKELLELTKITYGQLYRWKRKQLIPEEWFVKRSSYTGQETYFPRDKVLERIDKILNLKDGLSLDEMADTFSVASKDLEITLEQFQEKKLVSDMIIENYKTMFPNQLSFVDILGLMVCDEQLKQGLINLEEGRELLQFLKTELAQLPEKAFELRYMRKLGVGFWVLTEMNQTLAFDAGAKVIVNLSVQTYMERIKTLF